MAYQIKDRDLLLRLRKLAVRKKGSVIDVIRDAVQHEEDRENARATTMELLRPIHAKVRAMGSNAPASPEEEKRIAEELWGQG